MQIVYCYDNLEKHYLIFYSENFKFNKKKITLNHTLKFLFITTKFKLYKEQYLKVIEIKELNI